MLYKSWKENDCLLQTCFLGRRRKRQKMNALSAIKWGLAQRFALWPTLNCWYVVIATIGKRKNEIKKDMLTSQFCHNLKVSYFRHPQLWHIKGSERGWPFEMCDDTLFWVLLVTQKWRSTWFEQRETIHMITAVLNWCCHTIVKRSNHVFLLHSCISQYSNMISICHKRLLTLTFPVWRVKLTKRLKCG